MIREKIAHALVLQSTKKMISLLRRSALKTEAEDELSEQSNATRLGGAPTVPPDFQWPCFTCESYDDETVKPRPLAFLAQFRCDELTAIAPGNPLPAEGMLSFFYELGSQRWGFSPEDAGCARVYWFPDTEKLQLAEFPQDLPQEWQLPAHSVRITEEISYPAWEDVAALQPRLNWDIYEEVTEKLGIEEEPYTKLLGWPDIIQNNMTEECEMVSRGYYMGGSNPPEGLSCPPDVTASRALAERLMEIRQSVQNWRLLWQLESETAEKLGLMFGDCGTIYFYIREEDLKERRFDRVWLILQCG